MKAFLTITTCWMIYCISATGFALSERAFQGAPPDDTHPYTVHDMRRPAPRVVTPGAKPGMPPSDAIVLFDGSGVSEWISDKEEGGPCPWVIRDGALEVVSRSGNIRTKREFGDCQLHIEWMIPQNAQGVSQRRGNSGIFLMGVYEIQVLESFSNPTYPDGQAAAIYGQHPPLVNASRAPGEWQSYDIIFRRPVFEGDKVVSPATMTVFQNGVLVQDHWVLEGNTPHLKRASYEPHPDKGPLKLQDHRDPPPTVRFRNIWIRELEPKGADGLEPPYLSKAAVAAKRKELAETVKKEADAILAQGDLPIGLLTLLESLVYVKNTEVVGRVEKLAAQYLEGMGKLSHADLEAKKDELRKMAAAYKYLSNYEILPDTFQPMVNLNAFIKKHGLDEKEEK